jgi:hypothetical protein
VKLTVRERRDVTTDVEVVLPFYRYHDVGHDHGKSEICTKVYEVSGNVLRELVIRRSHGWGGGLEWAVENRSLSPSAGTADYILGRGEYALTEAKWAETLAEFLSWLRAQFMVAP